MVRTLVLMFVVVLVAVALPPATAGTAHSGERLVDDPHPLTPASELANVTDSTPSESALEGCNDG